MLEQIIELDLTMDREMIYAVGTIMGIIYDYFNDCKKLNQPLKQTELHNKLYHMKILHSKSKYNYERTDDVINQLLR